MPKVALLVIATGNYKQFVGPLLQGANEFFLPGCEVTYFIFTDAVCEEYALWGNGRGGRRIEVRQLEHTGFKDLMLRRYAILLRESGALSDFEHVFSVDADMAFRSYISPEILGERVACLHPGYWAKGTKGTPERNPLSTAYIPESTPNKYYCGGVVGGSSSEFLRMARDIQEGIEFDNRNGIVAVWNEESHLNRWFLDNPPTLTLHPGFCYDPRFRIPMEPKIEALNKKKFPGF